MTIDISNFKSIPLSSIAPGPLSTQLPNKMLSEHLKRGILHFLLPLREIL